MTKGLTITKEIHFGSGRRGRRVIAEGAAAKAPELLLDLGQAVSTLCARPQMLEVTPEPMIRLCRGSCGKNGGGDIVWGWMGFSEATGV